MTQRTDTCKQCGASLKGKRGDAEFCNARCTAAWTRENGYHRERFHQEKSETHSKNCEYCGTEFFYNVYAERKGQRVPKFCSNKCRTYDWRAKHKDSTFDGGANAWQEGRNDKTQRKGTATGGTEREKQDRQDNARSQRQREEYRYEQTYKHTSQGADKDTSQGSAKHTSQNQQKKHTSHDTRWDSKDPRVVLGCNVSFTKAQIKAAYMKLVKQWHPDRCTDPNANYIMQRINAAWDKLK